MRLYKNTAAGRKLTLSVGYGLAVALLAGCATTAAVREPAVRTVTVNKPVYIRPTPPDWLMKPPLTGGEPITIFILPTDSSAVLGVSRQGLSDLWRVIDSLNGRIAEWQAWAGVCPADSDKGECVPASGIQSTDNEETHVRTDQ